jgi:hypothetical protein
MKHFDNPIYSTYQTHLDLIAASVGLRFIGPPGARGQIVSANCVVSELLLTGDALVRVGVDGTPALNLTMTVPFTASAVNDSVVAAQKEAGRTFLAADTVHQIDTDGGASTTGEAEVEVVVAWERL